MTKVFIGGSRKLSRLNLAVIERLDNIIAKNYTVLIGDANGMDKAVQKYLADRGYGEVLVYCMNASCRNNIGAWPTVNVTSTSKRRDFQYYSTKDKEMARDAAYGFMLWDGKSRGTLRNVRDMVDSCKSVLLYWSVHQSFHTFGNASELSAFLGDSGLEESGLPQQYTSTTPGAGISQREIEFN